MHVRTSSYVRARAYVQGFTRSSFSNRRSSRRNRSGSRSCLAPTVIADSARCSRPPRSFEDQCTVPCSARLHGVRELGHRLRPVHLPNVGRVIAKVPAPRGRLPDKGTPPSSPSQPPHAQPRSRAYPIPLFSRLTTASDCYVRSPCHRDRPSAMRDALPRSTLVSRSLRTRMCLQIDSIPARSYLPNHPFCD